METRFKRTCKVCGKEVETDTHYFEYALVRTDNSGETFVEFDACPNCLNKIVDAISTLLTKG